MTRTQRFLPTAATTALLAVLAAGCNNDKLTSINNNPNSPTSAPPTAVFTDAIQTSVGNWLGSGYDLRDIGLIVQHFAENQYIGNDQYQGVNSTSLNGNWTGAYANDLEDYQVVIRAGTAAKNPGLWAPASIMQQWVYGYLTDTWGDIPYSQALEADSSAAILSPAYDPQQAVYTGMMAKLTAASAALSGATDAFNGADPIYNGNPAQWQKFANSLHARDAMRIVNVDPATTDKELKAAFAAAGGLITSNGDNAELRWPGDGVFNNPWAQNFSSRDDDRMSKTLIDTLNHYNDPRVAIYALPASATGKFAGQPNGLTNATAVAYSDSASRPGAVFYPGPIAYAPGNLGGSGNSFPSFMFTAAEGNLIMAEAAQRGLGGLTSAQAAGFYNAGITASMNQWGVTDAAKVAAYLAQPSVALQAGTAGLKQIALQKWIALYGDAGQAWFEWRRTCTPSLVKAKISIFNYSPRRIKYPSSELSANNSAVQAAATRMGGDANNTPVWWDKTSAAPTCQ
ncbi:MAG: SusD/RagB family nutrient-binding outer membrane lipoprotein [Gemmatimonadales bacterium]